MSYMYAIHSAGRSKARLQEMSKISLGLKPVGPRHPSGALFAVDAHEGSVERQRNVVLQRKLFSIQQDKLHVDAQDDYNGHANIRYMGMLVFMGFVPM
eukprot:941413-Amorphochlora_amoeboformis.AAC.1